MMGPSVITAVRVSVGYLQAHARARGLHEEIEGARRVHHRWCGMGASDVARRPGGCRSLMQMSLPRQGLFVFAQT